MIASRAQTIIKIKNKTPSTKALDLNSIKNAAINDIFDIIRNWFEYKVINILSILDSLQKYAFLLE
jgi:hypothetical protein